MQNFTPTKPYFVRAVYDWCVDNSLTPYVAVAVDGRTRVPQQFVRDGQIVLNVAPYATHQLEISNEALSCQARFGGIAQMIYLPLENIMAIYARENGRGMAFEPGMHWGTAMELGGLVEEEAASLQAKEESTGITSITGISKVGKQDEDATDPEPDSPAPTPSGSRLRVVK